jgi:hypothetical protein
MAVGGRDRLEPSLTRGKIAKVLTGEKDRKFWVEVATAEFINFNLAEGFQETISGLRRRRC